MPGLHNRLLRWYRAQGRSLPWRHTTDPYAILVSEVMLQQTQVDRVTPKYHDFLSRFPSFASLARAHPADVIRSWSPLGYNRRAVRLQQLAAKVTGEFGGELPQDPGELRRLDGIGAYTAAAVACFAFGKRVAVLDTNVKRVLRRVFHGTAPLPDRELGELAERVLPDGPVAADWNQALMDLGASLCTARRPRCTLCPLRRQCVAAPQLQEPAQQIAETQATYRVQPPFKGSSRYYRGRIVEYLRSLRDRADVDLPTLAHGICPEDVPVLDEDRLLGLVQGLERDGLVHVERPAAGDGGPVRVGLPPGDG